jgi:hypothetical protein
MNFALKEVTETAVKRFSECPLGKLAKNKVFDKPMSEYDQPLEITVEDVQEADLSIENKHHSPLETTDDVHEINLPIKNKMDGLARENEVRGELEEQYPSPPHTIISEAYLRDKDGNIVKDPKTGEARRIDFVVVKDGKVIDSIEVTSKTADKTEQSSKEQRIRARGGNYIKMPDGSLAEIPEGITTHIERRD